MSIWFMHDNHTFKRLDTLTVDEAMDYCEVWGEKEGGGMIGCKEPHGNECIHIGGGRSWRTRARELLRAADPTPTVDEVPK